MGAEPQIGVDAVLEDSEPGFLESYRLGTRERLVGDIGQSGAAPQLKRLAEESRGAAIVTGRRRRASPGTGRSARRRARQVPGPRGSRASAS